MNPTLGLGLLLAGLLTVEGLQKLNCPSENHGTMSRVQGSKGRRQAHELSRRNLDFGVKMLKKLTSKHPGKNIFISPLSISIAFSMLSLGAQNSTLDEIKQAFNFSGMSEKDRHEGFHCLIGRLNQDSQDHKLNLGNTLFIDQRLQPQQKFLTEAKELYNTETISTNFQDLEDSKKQINDYVSQKTHGKINNLVKNIDPSTVLLLTNYIFFQARWKHEFDPKATKEEDFTIDGNKSVKVPMMFRGGMYDAALDDQLSCTILEMPFHNNISATFILPEEGKMEQVEKGLNTDTLARWRTSMSHRVVDVSMPRLSFSATYNLKTVLPELGMTRAFQEHGEFNRISPRGNLKVGEAVHQADLKMDEKGAEGAAGSAAQTLPMEKPLVFKTDKPFLMMVFDKTKSFLLFLGKISNPRGT